MPELPWTRVKELYFLSGLNLSTGFALFYWSGDNPLLMLLGLGFVSGGTRQLSKAGSGHVARRRKERRLLEIAAKTFRNRDDAMGWMHTPKRALGGETPWDYAESEEKIREIEELLERIDHGIFS